MDDLESAYESKSLQFPALDEPYNRDAEAENLTLHPEIGKTIDLVIAASYQLLSTVRHPFLTLADASSAVRILPVEQQIWSGKWLIPRIASITSQLAFVSLRN